MNALATQFTGIIKDPQEFIFEALRYISAAYAILTITYYWSYNEAILELKREEELRPMTFTTAFLDIVIYQKLFFRRLSSRLSKEDS